MQVDYVVVRVAADAVPRAVRTVCRPTTAVGPVTATSALEHPKQCRTLSLIINDTVGGRLRG